MESPPSTTAVRTKLAFADPEAPTDLNPSARSPRKTASTIITFAPPSSRRGSLVGSSDPSPAPSVPESRQPRRTARGTVGARDARAAAEAASSAVIAAIPPPGHGPQTQWDDYAISAPSQQSLTALEMLEKDLASLEQLVADASWGKEADAALRQRDRMQRAPPPGSNSHLNSGRSAVPLSQSILTAGDLQDRLMQRLSRRSQLAKMLLDETLSDQALHDFVVEPPARPTKPPYDDYTRAPMNAAEGPGPFASSLNAARGLPAQAPSPKQASHRALVASSPVEFDEAEEDSSAGVDISPIPPSPEVAAFLLLVSRYRSVTRGVYSAKAIAESAMSRATFSALHASTVRDETKLDWLMKRLNEAKSSLNVALTNADRSSSGTGGGVILDRKAAMESAEIALTSSLARLETKREELVQLRAAEGSLRDIVDRHVGKMQEQEARYRAERDWLLPRVKELEIAGQVVCETVLCAKNTTAQITKMIKAKAKELTEMQIANKDQENANDMWENARIRREARKAAIIQQMESRSRLALVAATACSVSEAAAVTSESERVAAAKEHEELEEFVRVQSAYIVDTCDKLAKVNEEIEVHKKCIGEKERQLLRFRSQISMKKQEIEQHEQKLNASGRVTMAYKADLAAEIERTQNKLKAEAVRRSELQEELSSLEQHMFELELQAAEKKAAAGIFSDGEGSDDESAISSHSGALSDDDSGEDGNDGGRSLGGEDSGREDD